jgi:hypothetical protein
MVTLRRGSIAFAILILPVLFLGFALASASAARPVLEAQPLLVLPQEAQRNNHGEAGATPLFRRCLARWAQRPSPQRRWLSQF